MGSRKPPLALLGLTLGKDPISQSPLPRVASNCMAWAFREVS
jgi:hypothetical protein